MTRYEPCGWVSASRSAPPTPRRSPPWTAVANSQAHWCAAAGRGNRSWFCRCPVNRRTDKLAHMIVVRDGELSEFSSRDSVIAIGVFDGLHLGHQAVIDMLLHLDGERARDAVPTIVTFDPHPAQVLAPDRAPRLLGTLEQRLEGFQALGIEQVRVLTFDRTLAD